MFSLCRRGPYSRRCLTILRVVMILPTGKASDCRRRDGALYSLGAMDVSPCWSRMALSALSPAVCFRETFGLGAYRAYAWIVGPVLTRMKVCTNWSPLGCLRHTHGLERYTPRLWSPYCFS